MALHTTIALKSAASLVFSRGTNPSTSASSHHISLSLVDKRLHALTRATRKPFQLRSFLCRNRNHCDFGCLFTIILFSSSSPPSQRPASHAVSAKLRRPWVCIEAIARIRTRRLSQPGVASGYPVVAGAHIVILSPSTMMLTGGQSTRTNSPHLPCDGGH